MPALFAIAFVVGPLMNFAFAGVGDSGAVAFVGSGYGGDRVTICHNPGPTQTELSLPAPAVPAHLAHGDSVGPCLD